MDHNNDWLIQGSILKKQQHCTLCYFLKRIQQLGFAGFYKGGHFFKEVDKIGMYIIH